MADNFFDHLLVFDTEDQCRSLLLENAILADHQQPLVVNADATDGKWFNAAYADAGIQVTLQVFGQREVCAPGFRLLVQSLEVREDLWNLRPGVCELILDRSAGCEGRDFVIRSQPGREIYSVLFSPVFVGSCYPDRREDEFRRFFEALASINNVQTLPFYRPVAFDNLAFTQVILDELEGRLGRARALVERSNTLGAHEKNFLLGSINAAVEYLREHPYKSTISVFLFLIGSPLYAAYSSALEDAARPYFAEFIGLVVQLIVHALS